MAGGRGAVLRDVCEVPISRDNQSIVAALLLGMTWVQEVSRLEKYLERVPRVSEAMHEARELSPQGSDPPLISGLLGVCRWVDHDDIWLDPLGRNERSLGPHHPKFVRTRCHARCAPADIDVTPGNISELNPPGHAIQLSPVLEEAGSPHF